jgi:HAE1 family hydrophobic/amphiphilic exporter-1
MFARFFINRPIFANVIAVITIVIGALSWWRLSVEQYPQITPPTIYVSTIYPGANAQVVADTVAAPIEEQINGVENMLYMSSTCANDGSYTLVVTFAVGTDLNMAQVLVQNRVAIAMPLLPGDVQKQGVITKKRSTSITMFVALKSPHDTHDTIYLANYATIRIVDELSRLPGVGDIRPVPAADYSMRIWLDPEKLQAHNISTDDIVNALTEQNVQVLAGQVGQPPYAKGQNFQLAISALGRLKEPAEFENIIIKNQAEGGTRLMRLKDVARVEMGGQNYDQYFKVNGKNAAGLAIYQLPGSNALDVAHEIKAKMEELKKSFPDDLDYCVPLDTTTFISASIEEVNWTLGIAGVLVLAVITLFLQDFWATLVPLTTVPVTIIGAFAAMALLGFTINLLTMFGLVLAVGVVVDDAIVVVEGAAHYVERGLPAKEAAAKAMDELLAPIIGITLVLLAVFLPTVFMGGITGQLYQQFALTIAATALISALNAMTLKPAQCGQWLRKPPERHNGFFRLFNYFYGKLENAYYEIIKRVVRHCAPALLVFGALIFLAIYLFISLPTAFLPVDDQGYIIMFAQLPDAASQERTREVVDRINKILHDTPGVEDINCMGGVSFIDGTSASNMASFFVHLHDWAERDKHGEEQSIEGIRDHVVKEVSKIQDAVVNVIIPPAIRGLGTATIQMMIQDRGGVGTTEMQDATDEVIGEATRVDSNGVKVHPEIARVFTTFRANVPQLFVEVDRTKVKTLGIPLSSVFNTLQDYMSPYYVNDFNKYGRTFEVVVQADKKFRADASQIKSMQVRNSAGKMAPLGTLLNIKNITGPQVIPRYNLYQAAMVSGEAAPGYSSGDTLRAMAKICEQKLPSAMGYEWTGMSFQEKSVEGQAFFIFGLAVLLIYLILAAQYESWTDPAAVILVVPLGLLGAAIAVGLRGMDNNIYTQIGIVLIIALASKNAILIVSYAKDLHANGKSIAEAAAEASRRRFRPILMTSFAFILGVLPLVIAHGAGAKSRRALGTVVFGGMLASTILAVAFVPVFYVVCQKFSEWWAKFWAKKPASQKP